MKKLLFVFFLIVSLSKISFSQNAFEVQYLDNSGNVVPTHSITRGGQDLKKVRLKITNPVGIVNGEYNFRSATGLYIENPTTNNTLTTLYLNPINHNELNIKVAVSSATSIDIDMDVWVGQCFTFLTNELSDKDLSSPFSILLVTNTNNSALHLSGNSNINIRKGAFLNYFENQGVHEAMPDNNKIATFSYVFENNSGVGFDFNGNFSFQESAVWSAYNIRQVNFYKWNKVSWVLIETKSNPIDNRIIGLNDNSFFTQQAITIPISILNGEKIKVEEIVQLNGCFQDGGTRSSSPLIRWGNATYDMCATPAGPPLGSFMLERTFSSNLVVTTLNGPNHYCYGGGETLRSYKIENTGNDVAKNILLNLMSGDYFYNSPFLIKYVENSGNDNQNIYMTVNGKKYILKLDKYNIDFNDPKLYTTTDRPSFVPGDVPPWTTDAFGLYSASLGRKKSQAPYTRFVPVNAYLTMDEYKRYQKITTSFPFSTQCIGGDLTSVKLIKDLYADEFKLANSTDDFAPLEIKPGDEVIFYWKEVNCCFGNEAINNSFTNSQVFLQYDDLCGLKQTNFGFGVSAIQHKFLPAATSGTTLGDVDRCRSTTDGLVERISATIQQYGAGVESPRFPDRYEFVNGRVVFRIYVQNGLDLDKSLEQPFNWGLTQQRGYDNATDSELYVNNISSGCKGAGCVADPVCNLTKVITNANEKYYVRLRPTAVGQGKFLIPKSIELKEHDIQTPPPNSNLANMPGLNAELIFDDNKNYANQLYEIAYNVEDLVAFYKAELNLTTVDKLTAVNAVLNQCVLDFDLRAYCSANGKPAYKVVMYHDRCSNDVPSQYRPSSCNPGFTSMQPIAAFGNSMIVNCPGCKIPGANIEISSLVRSENSRGLVDANQDRLPDNDHDQLPDAHPTLKNVAMGDEMTAKFSCYMSDGESANGLGISKMELETAANAGNPNFYLDNFMIQGQFTGGAITRGANKNIEIVYVRMTHKGREKIYQIGNPNDDFLSHHLFFPSDGSFILRAKISDFYNTNELAPNSFAPGFDERIDFELHYQIGDMGDAITTSEITYAPYYTPCDNCDAITNTMVLVNPSDNPHFSPFTLDALAEAGGETLWKCSGFSNRFKFIPYKQLSAYTAGDNNCTKSVAINFTGNFLPDGVNVDYFKEEYRTFLKSDLRTEILIPNGYIPFKIEITNTFKINNTFKQEKYLITDPNLIVKYDNPNNQQDNNQEYDKLIKLLVKFNDVNSYPTYDVNAFIGKNNVKIVNNAFPDGTVHNDTARMFIRGDEFYNVSVVVSYKVDPAAVCSAIPEHFIWQGTGNVWNRGRMLFSNKANSPSFFYINVTKPSESINPQFRIIEANPHAVFLPEATYQVDDVNGANGVVASFEKPVAKLSTRNLEAKTIILSESKLIQIPIEISNEKINTWKINNADFPYIQIYGDALTKGLKFIGVYKGNKNILLPTSSNYYNEYEVSSQDLINEGILVGIDFQAAHVRNPMWNPIPLLPNNLGVSQYTLVFENTCPENCNQNIGCGTENSLPPNCLVGQDNLKIKVGWNCNNFPSFQNLRDHKTCGALNDVINYTVNVAPVGLTLNASINTIALANAQIMELEPCGADNIYSVTLNSCKEIGFNEYAIEFSGLSSEITIMPKDRPTDDPIHIEKDTNPAKPNLFHITTTSSSLLKGVATIDFNITTNSCNIPNQTLTTIVSSKTFCTPTAQVNFTFNNPLQMKINPVTTISDQLTVFSSNVSVVNGNHLAISYSLTGAGSGVTKFDNSISVKLVDGSTTIYSGTIAIPAGTADGIINKDIALGITTCGNYTAILTPQKGVVPSCGLDVNGAVIPACINYVNGTPVSKNVVLGTPLVASITTVDGYASFLCSSGSKVTLVAYPQTAGLTYSWSGPGIVGPTNTNTIEATGVGTYSVVITNLCGSASAAANVVNELHIVCPQPICPGELPDIVVTNFNGVVGTYKSQWYNPSGSDGTTQTDLEDDILMDKGIITSGYYYAATIIPSCTLRTNARNPEECQITVKRAPNAYHISSDRPSGDAPVLFLCDGETTTLRVTDKSVNNVFPTDVIWRSGQTTTDDIVAPGTWANPGNLLTAQELSKSAYFIVAIDKETQCRTASNEIAIETPIVSIIRACDNASGIKLTAVSNFNVMPDQYDWQLDGSPLIQGTNEVTASTPGVYTVIENSTGCARTNRCWGIKENLNIHSSSNEELLSLQSRSFEGITATQIPLGFDTEFLPLDRTGYTGAPLPANYTIGKFMINESGLQASDWSPNIPSSWVNSNTTYTGTGAMFIDGESEPAPKLIWGQTIPVTHGLNYLYRFNVRNISLLTQYPVEEIPELYAQVTYMDNAGNGTRYMTSKQALFNNGQTPWIEFSSYTPAIPVTLFDCLNPAEIQTVRLELFMDGGGSIGRDIAVDEVSLIPIGICDDVTAIDLPCKAALAQLDNNQLIICPGTTAQFNVINAPAGLTYEWKSVEGTTLTSVGTGASFVTPVLNLTDPLIPASFQYEVTITDPENQCQVRERAKAIVSALPRLSITNSWSGSSCETKFVAIFDGLGTPAQFDWYLNGNLVSGANTTTYVANNLQINDVVQCKVNHVWCSGLLPVESNSITISDIGLQANAGPDKEICAGESVLIGTTENTDASYLWSPATHLNDATKAQPISTHAEEGKYLYTLTLTDLTTGCISQDQVEITVHSTPEFTITNPGAVCAPEVVDITSASVIQSPSSVLNYAFYSDAVATNILPNPNALTTSGTYYIQATSIEGCKIIKPVVVDVKSEAKVVITNPAPVDTPATVNLTVPAITAGSTAGLVYTYYTDNAATTLLAAPASVTSSGTYYIKGTATNGCFDIEPVEVSIEHVLSNQSSAGSMNVSLNPNPFSVQAYMTVSGASSNYVKATIIDMNGNVLFENAHVLNNEPTAIGMELPSAVYILKIMDGDKIKIMKFVKL